MLLSFAPFLVAFRSALQQVRMGGQRAVSLLLASGVFFTLYQSLFGYPRDDAYQSLYCFLGLAIWVALQQPDDDVTRPERLLS